MSTTSPSQKIYRLSRHLHSLQCETRCRQLQRLSHKSLHAARRRRQCALLRCVHICMRTQMRQAEARHMRTYALIATRGKMLSFAEPMNDSLWSTDLQADSVHSASDRTETVFVSSVTHLQRVPRLSLPRAHFCSNVDAALDYSHTRSCSVVQYAPKEHRTSLLHQTTDEIWLVL